jgi:hypothetical protein
MLTKTFVEDCASEFQNFHMNIHRFHTLFSTNYHVGYHKFCARWVSKILTGASFTFLERYHKDGNEFLNHILTSDETWVSFVNVESKGQSKQWMHTHSPDKLKILSISCLPETDGNCFLGQERGADY